MLAGVRSPSESANTAVAPAEKRFSRTTVILPEALKRNIDLLAASNRRPIGEVIREALAQYVSQHGLVPEVVPQVKFSYGEENNDVR
jgi:hypothetical protein